MVAGGGAVLLVVVVVRIFPVSAGERQTVGRKMRWAKMKRMIKHEE